MSDLSGFPVTKIIKKGNGQVRNLFSVFCGNGIDAELSPILDGGECNRCIKGKGEVGRYVERSY